MRFITPIAACWFALSAAVHAQDIDKAIAAFQVGDYATALAECRPLVEQGHPGAQFCLGLLYANGQGVPQDDAAAVRWYRLAADQGHAAAQTNLGWMYEQGRSGALVSPGS